MTDHSLAGGTDGLGLITDMPTEPGGSPLRFSSTLRPSSFLGLSLKNGLLNLITITLYRFWGKTEVRQRVWSGVRLNDEAFEYTGRGLELFVGFVLALVALGLPFLVIFFLAQFAGPVVILVLYLPMYLFMLWLWGFGVFSAFRYMASRTTWRGVRFRLRGSAQSYGFKYIGAVFLSGLSLGWYWPTAERGLAGAIWDELRYGDRRIHFRMARAEREGVYGAFAIGWVLSIIPYFGLMTALGVIGAMQPGLAATTPEWVMVLAIYGVMLALAPLFLLIWAPYQAAMLRSVTAGVTIDDAAFRLDVKAIPLWWLTVSNMFLILITLGFLMPWAQARTARFLVERLVSTGTARLDEAQQAGRGPQSGEGLADAFGFSVI